MAGDAAPRKITFMARRRRLHDLVDLWRGNISDENADKAERSPTI